MGERCRILPLRSFSKSWKPGEYYSIQREGRGFRESVVHRDAIKELEISKKLHAYGRVGRLLARSRRFHIDHEAIAKEKYQKKIRSMSQQDLFSIDTRTQTTICF